MMNAIYIFAGVIVGTVIIRQIDKKRKKWPPLVEPQGRPEGREKKRQQERKSLLPDCRK